MYAAVTGAAQADLEAVDLVGARPWRIMCQQNRFSSSRAAGARLHERLGERDGRDS
jgi:hypothetical protein